MKYIVRGYTGPNPDFTDTIEISEDFSFEALIPRSDPRYDEGYSTFHDALIETSIPSDYLDCIDDGGYELRADLADTSKLEHVICGEFYGCNNCQEQGDNEYTDGCDDDEPHGGFMLTFEPVEGAL